VATAGEAEQLLIPFGNKSPSSAAACGVPCEEGASRAKLRGAQAPLSAPIEAQTNPIVTLLLLWENIN
jgi:hypothetical protein